MDTAIIGYAVMIDWFDRNAQRLLNAAAGAMGLFFAIFVIVLANATASRAEDGVVRCTGVNLVEKYRVEDKARYDEMRAAADATLNGRGVFWRIEKLGIEPSFLLGTMHMADERIVGLPGKRGEALDAASTVAVEIAELLDPELTMAGMLANKDLALITDGTTIEDRLDPVQVAQLRTALKARGMPFGAAKNLRPWMITAAITLPVCESAAKATGAPVLDILIANRAKTGGKQLVGLETMREQFLAITALPEAYHLQSLKEILAMGAMVDDIFETMKQLYLKGEIGMIMPFARAVMHESDAIDRAVDGSIVSAELIENRNVTMAERSLSYLEKGNAFIAVGALHLPGETGLVEAFRRAGYTVTLGE